MLQQYGTDHHVKPLLRSIRLQLVVYVYDAAEDTFKRLPDMPVGTSSQVHNAKLALRLIDQGDVNDCPPWQKQQMKSATKVVQYDSAQHGARSTLHHTTCLDITV